MPDDSDVWMFGSATLMTVLSRKVRNRTAQRLASARRCTSLPLGTRGRRRALQFQEPTEGGVSDLPCGSGLHSSTGSILETGHGQLPCDLERVDDGRGGWARQLD